MEYTQWVKKSVDEWAIKNVLILVVMEYTQWVICKICCWEVETTVLILVVMEYTQWELALWFIPSKFRGS